MKKPPATDSFLTVISCACTKFCEKYCGCRKAGMRCFIICKHCQGTSCLNQSPICGDSDDDDDKEINNERKSFNVDEDGNEEESQPCKKKRHALFND